MRKILFTLMMAAFLLCPVIAHGVGTQKQIQFVDEWGDPVNMGTSVSIYIYDVTTTTEQTCYTNNTGATAYVVTQPVTDDSDNTVIDYTTGLMTFWSTKAGYKLTVTDGTYTRTVDNLHGGITRFSWPSYLVAMASRTVGDDQTWIIGSGSDVTFDWDNTNSKMTITAAADYTIDIGADDYQFDLKLFADTDDDFILWDNDAESWEYVGAQAHFDDDSEIWIGSDKDWKIESATTKILDILPLVGDETYKVNIGATTAGADLKVWGTDGTDYMEWDSSADLFTIVGDEVALTLSGTGTNAFDLNCSGGIDIEAVGGATLDITAATDGSGGFKIQTTVPTGLQLYGGVYSQVTVAGTTDGAVGAFRGRVDLDSSSAPVGYVQGARITVEEVGADLSGAVICPLILETYCDAGGNDPLAHYMMRFNTSQGAEMPDAWFMAANPESIAYEANLLHGASATDKIGAIKIVIGGAIGDAYIYLYSTAGQ